MTDITTAQIVEAGRDAVTSCRWDHTLAHASNGGPMWTDSDLAQAAYDAMLPLIRKQLADEVRGMADFNPPGYFAAHPSGLIDRDRAARLIEGVEG